LAFYPPSDGLDMKYLLRGMCSYLGGLVATTNCVFAFVGKKKTNACTRQTKVLLTLNSIVCTGYAFSAVYYPSPLISLPLVTYCWHK